MTTLGQSLDTVLDQTPEWLMKQSQIESEKLDVEKKQKPMTRHEYVSMVSKANGFNRELNGY